MSSSNPTMDKSFMGMPLHQNALKPLGNGLNELEIIGAASFANVASGFVVDFLMGGVSAAISKTAAAPIER
ncbi:hypothetical protein LTS18_009386, partial [Coniosporium uncinatum]